MILQRMKKKPLRKEEDKNKNRKKPNLLFSEAITRFT